MPMSSRIWWVAPSSPSVMPAWSADLDVLTGIRDRLTDLVVNTSGREIGEGARERDLAADCHARSEAHHVRLGNADLEKAVREFFLKGIHLETAGQVGAECDDLRVAAAQFEEPGAKAGAGVFLVGKSETFHAGGVGSIHDDDIRFAGHNREFLFECVDTFPEARGRKTAR